MIIGIILTVIIFILVLLTGCIISVPTKRSGIQPKTDPKPNPPKGAKL